MAERNLCTTETVGQRSQALITSSEVERVMKLVALQTPNKMTAKLVQIQDQR